MKKKFFFFYLVFFFVFFVFFPLHPISSFLKALLMVTVSL